MNSIVRDYYPTFRLYQRLREHLMDSLEDADLGFIPGGGNPPLGVLCREIGEVEQAYIDSFRTFTQDFSYRAGDPALETSVASLKAWYGRLDSELKEVIEGLSDDDLQNRLVDRGHGFTIPPAIQLEIYKEALLIFYGKVSVYLKAMGRERSEQWQEWIA